MTIRVCTFASKTAAQEQVRAINAHYMSEIHGGADAVTRRYVLLTRYADGAWGHIVDSVVRAMADAGVVSLASERDIPTAPVTLPDGTVSVGAKILEVDETGSDAS